MQAVILGARFGGLELATSLSEQLGDEADIVVVDQAEGLIFGCFKLDAMFGRVDAEHVVHPYREMVHPGVRFVQSTDDPRDRPHGQEGPGSPLRVGFR
jgi:sulfide:quinone oxidoreductase